MKVIDEFTGRHFFLSNFFERGVDGYPVENWYQSFKTLDEVTRMKIRVAGSPGLAKRLGRKVSLRRDWEEIKDPIMFGLLLLKFEDGDLRAKLLATGSAILVEGNDWHDNYWGDCRCGSELCREEGENMLGQLLMKVRRLYL